MEKFVEKPDIATAETYFRSGDFYWNSGVFTWNVDTILEEFKNQMPALYSSFAPLIEMSHEKIASDTPEVWALKEKIFSEIESISIDYGILENAHKRMVIPGDFGWGDLGSWKSIDDIIEPDKDDNRSNNDNSIFVKSSNSSVFTERNNFV